MLTLLHRPKFFLSAMIFTAVLMVGVRLGDVWYSMTTGKPFHAVKISQAADETPQTQPQPEAATAEPAPQPQPTPEAAPPQAAPAPAPQPRYSAPVTLSPDSDLYKQLSGRREELDKREGELAKRLALLEVAEKRVDQKLKEMETLRAQLQTLLNQADAAQAAQIDSLVKIYEIMKPKEAARIFEALDMHVLLGVVKRMKPARSAPILAEMSPEKAMEVTTALTRQDRLPQMP
ncbi:MAG: hypothetical protein FWF24_00525 [Alphaproteobacteria bacterium]|nr:hypothetical protein [Alphaproteobacteria bacterium]